MPPNPDRPSTDRVGRPGATASRSTPGFSFAYQQTGAWSGSVGLAVCWLEIVPVVLIWLVFFPPTGYRRWLNGSVPAEL